MFLISFYTIQTSFNVEFYVRNPRDSVLADEDSAGVRSHERLSDKETVNTGQHSCALSVPDLLLEETTVQCLIF